MRTSSNPAVIYAALLKIQEEGILENIKKNKKADAFGGYRYADLAATLDDIKAALKAVGLGITQSPDLLDNGPFPPSWVLTTRVFNAEGEYLDNFSPIIVVDRETKDKKTGEPKVSAPDAQSYGSGISYARRYGALSLMAIATEDDDGAGASGR